jgi:hypothetical protein
MGGGEGSLKRAGLSAIPKNIFAIIRRDYEF